MAVARGAAAGVAMTGSESGIARNRNGKAMSTNASSAGSGNLKVNGKAKAFTAPAALQSLRSRVTKKTTMRILARPVSLG